MLVTASSEDGGEETVICPPGSIIFSRSSESSGRSTPDIIFADGKFSNVDETKQFIAEHPLDKQLEDTKAAGEPDTVLKTAEVVVTDTAVSTDKHDSSVNSQIKADILSSTCVEDEKETVSFAEIQKKLEDKNILDDLLPSTHQIKDVDTKKPSDEEQRIEANKSVDDGHKDKASSIGKAVGQNDLEKSTDEAQVLVSSETAEKSALEAILESTVSAKGHDDVSTKEKEEEKSKEIKEELSAEKIQQTQRSSENVKTESASTDQSLLQHTDSTKVASELSKIDVKHSETTAISVKLSETVSQKHEEQLKVDEEVELNIDMDTAGPSSTKRKESLNGHLSQSKTSIDDIHLSGKSTPDIADVEKLKEMEEILKYEKHIPGSSTPPTVPVSPIVHGHGSPEKRVSGVFTNIEEPQKQDSKKAADTSVLSLAKELELGRSTPGSADLEISEVSSLQEMRGSSLCQSEKNESEDDDLPGSPTSVTSQVAYSPSLSHYDFKDGNDKFTSKVDTMNLSFYGTLPGEHVESKETHSFLDEDDVDFEKAMQEHRQARGEDLGKDTASTYLYEVTKAKYSTKVVVEKEQGEHSGVTLPVVHEQDLMTCSFIGSQLPTGDSAELKDEKDPVKEWGKPLGLPSPLPLVITRVRQKKKENFLLTLVLRINLMTIKGNQSLL